jgi:hypothetical protein
MGALSFKKAIRISGLSLGFVLVLIGVACFVVALLAYLSNDTSVVSFRLMLISGTMISIPACGYFSYKIYAFYKEQQNKYNMPDTPLKFYAFVLMFALFSLVMIASLGIYLLTL